MGLPGVCYHTDNSSYIYVGTKTIVQSFKVTEVGTDFLTLQWKANNQYSGFYWKVTGDYALKSDSLRYATLRMKLPKNHSEITLSDVKPGSICYINLRAHFILARTDNGLDLVGQTHSCSK